MKRILSLLLLLLVVQYVSGQNKPDLTISQHNILDTNATGSTNGGHAVNRARNITGENVIIDGLQQLIYMAEHGDIEAQFSLGFYYERGHVVSQSYTEAVKWYRMASNAGSPKAHFQLGVMYVNGTGVEQSYESAVECFLFAANHGDVVAQYNLGLCYLYGYGVTESIETAKSWFKKSAEGGYPDAIDALLKLAGK